MLIREPSTDDGTFGLIVLDDETTFHTGELPWRNNDRGASCIPTGKYICKIINSPKHGKCYQVMDVPHRDMIEIHSANFMGDKSLGKQSQLLGCIALGKETMVSNGQKGIASSRVAINQFMDNLKDEDFELTIM